ncbi:MAG: hypothetical protein LC655_05225 [Bacteroidales bacterium]|nr:hypothetical protein [Bacteroidales bacterium]
MKAILSAVFAISFVAFANGQFLTPSPDSPNTQTPTEEVRTGSSIEYSLSGTHVAGEEYRWEVTGGTITAAPGGTISGGGTIVEFAEDAHTITVDWNQAPASAIVSLSGQLEVQKVSGSSCPSQVQILPINVWNLASAAIATGTESFCSGASPSVATIPVALTGAPDGTTEGFAVDYSFTIPAGLSALDGGGVAVATSGTVTTDGSSVNITLPATLINTTSGDLDFVVSLDRMNDDFTGNGTVSGTYTITVNPVPETGEIQSDFSLTRR